MGGWIRCWYFEYVYTRCSRFRIAWQLAPFCTHQIQFSAHAYFPFTTLYTHVYNSRVSYSSVHLGRRNYPLPAMPTHAWKNSEYILGKSSRASRSHRSIAPRHHECLCVSVFILYIKYMCIHGRKLSPEQVSLCVYVCVFIECRMYSRSRSICK